MNREKKFLVQLLLVTCFTMLFSVSAFAEGIPVVEEPTTEEVVTEELDEEPETVEPTTSFINVDLGYEVLLTVDENGIILAAEAIVDQEASTEEETSTEEEALTEEETSTEEGTSTEEDTSTEETNLESIIGSTIIDGIQILLDEDTTDTEVSLLVLSEDENLSNILSEMLIITFGDVVEVLEEPTLGEDSNPNAERFSYAKELNITPGKMNLIQKLEKSFLSDEQLDYTEWANKSVQEIIKAIKDNKKSPFEKVDSIDAEELDEENIDIEVNEQSKKEVIKGKKINKKQKK